MSLAYVYSEYVTSGRDNEQRDPLRLYITDVGKCPREVAYRMLEIEADPVTGQQLVNFNIMMDLAEHIEQTLADALAQDGKLVAYQERLDIPRDNWGGRLDIIADYDGGVRIIEVKTRHPNNFRYQVDRIEHHYQGWLYNYYCAEQWGLDEWPLLWYADRGGQNTPQEIECYDCPESLYMMDRLEETRNNLPDLPDKLGKVLQLRGAGKQIVYEPDTRCFQPYCKYTFACHQDMSKSVWAQRQKVKGEFTEWELQTKAIKDYRLLGEFIDSLISKQMEE